MLSCFQTVFVFSHKHVFATLANRGFITIASLLQNYLAKKAFFEKGWDFWVTVWIGGRGIGAFWSKFDILGIAFCLSSPAMNPSL
jgi:hypothetical protein